MRVAIVVVVAVVGFGVAWWLAGREPAAAPAPAAVTTAEPDATQPAATAAEGEAPAYEVAVTTEPDPPAAESTTFLVTVTLDGQPVTGAEVALQTDMSDMAHEGVQDTAEELGDGRYQLVLRFPMRGGWSGRLTVAEPGKARFAMPVSFAVQ